MKKLLILVWSCILLVSMVFAEPNDVQLIGHYDNIMTSNSSDSHQLGYGISLYLRTDGIVFGTFVYAPGMTEGINAVLYDIDVNDCGKTLKFKAKLSSGSEIHDGVYRETRELFVFEGVLLDQLISGKLIQKNGYEPMKIRKRILIKLKRDRSELNGTYVPSSYNEWLADAPTPVKW